MTISQQRPYGLRSRKQVGWVSPVRESHLPQAWELAQRDAVANAFVLSRIDAARKDMWRLSSGKDHVGVVRFVLKQVGSVSGPLCRRV